MKKERDITSFRHIKVRVNNPDIGVLDSKNNPLGQSANWKYDPYLDPSLSWAGKKEKESFYVDTVPLHVNERVDPLSIIANALKKKEGKTQGDLFHSSFENLPLDKALEFYQHDKNWANRIIAGDSLLIMNSLLLKEDMKEKIQMIYFDPPYGINYGSNFQPFSSKKPVVGEDKDENLSSEPEMIKAFRDTWELKIHSYLSYLRDRIMLGRELLNEEGSMFVQISDENLHYVRTIMSEIFGEKNYCAIIPFRKRQGRTGASKLPEQTHDFIVWYAKDKENMKYNQLWLDKPMTRKLHYYHGDKKITLDDKQQDEFRKAFCSQNNRRVSFVEDISEVFEHVPLGKTHTSKKNIFELDYMGDEYPSPKHGWATSRENLDRLARLDRLVPLQTSVEFKRYCLEGSKTRLTSIWSDTTGVTGAKYVVQTNDLPVQRCILMTTDPGDIVLDPTCGSGTTAFAAEKWGRRWITCDTSRVATTLAKSRLMTSLFDYWALANPESGIEGGFKYEEMMEVTASIIEKNEEIDEVYELVHKGVSEALSDLNEALKNHPPLSIKPHRGKRKGMQIDFKNGELLEEWEVPGTAPDDWSADAKKALVRFHSERQQMMSAINFSIRENARKHTLYDRPTVDPSRLRVSGPFTLESVPAPVVSRADGGSEDEIVHRDCWRSELEKTGIREIGGKILGVEHIEEMQGTKYLHAVGRLEGGGGGS